MSIADHVSRAMLAGGYALIVQLAKSLCAGDADPVVHQRIPKQYKASVITLCAACHALVYRLQAIDRWVPDPILGLWAVQHFGAPLQLQFQLAA